jgi:hypothetical protein
MASRRRSERWGELLAGLGSDIRSGRLLSEQPYNIAFCTCCEGDAWLRRCDDLRWPPRMRD